MLTVIGGAAGFLALIIIFWDGTRKRARGQGGIGPLIDLVLLGTVLSPHWPFVTLQVATQSIATATRWVYGRSISGLRGAICESCALNGRSLKREGS